MDTLTPALCSASVYIHGIFYMCDERGGHPMHKDHMARVVWARDEKGRVTWTFAR